jgi:hypothetical protein
MTKICEECKNSTKAHKEMDFKSPIVYMCNNLQYKQEIVKAAISNGNIEASKLTAKQIQELPFTTDKITSSCEFFDRKIKKSINLSQESLNKIFEMSSNDEIGIASNTMLYGVTGKSIYSNERDIPDDSDAFGRCLKLVDNIPEIGQNLNLLAENLPLWIPIVREWDNLKSIYLSNGDIYTALRDLKGEYHRMS